MENQEPCRTCIDKKLDTQHFCMRVAIVFSFTAPLVIYSLIYSAAMQGKTLGLHEEYALYVCLGNIASVIAYGFGGPPAIQRAKKKLGDVLKIGKKRDQ